MLWVRRLVCLLKRVDLCGGFMIVYVPISFLGFDQFSGKERLCPFNVHFWWSNPILIGIPNPYGMYDMASEGKG